MADDDNMEEGKKGGGLPGVAGGVAGVYAGGLAASHLVGKPKAEKITGAETAKTAAKTAYDAKLKTELEKTDSKLKAPHDAFTAAETAHKTAEATHKTALAEQWMAHITTEKDVAKIGKLWVANLQGQLEALNKLPVASAQKTWALEAVKAQLTAVEEAIKKDTFAKLTPDAAHDALETAERFGWKVTNEKTPELVGVKALMGKVDKSPSVFEALAKADKDMAAKVAEATSTTKTALETKATELETAKTALTKAEEEVGLKAEKAALTAAEKKVKSLTALEGLNAQKGAKAFLARPFKAFKHVGTGAKFAILASGVALGAIAYKGISAMRGGSHAERIEEERQTGGAAPSVG